MKKYFTKSLWLIIAALLVVSCSKEDGVMDSSSRSDNWKLASTSSRNQSQKLNPEQVLLT